MDKLLNHSHGLMLERIGHAVAALGTDRFHACLLRILDCLIASDIRLVLRYSRHAKPVYLVNEGLPRAAVDLYLAGYYQFDPAQELWRSGKNISVISFRDLSEELYRSSTEYFSVYAPRVNIADDLGMFMPGIGGAAVAIFLERRRSRFSPEDAATMRLVYPMFCDLYRAHLNSFFGTIMANEPSTASPEVSRAFIVLDAEGRKIYASPAWNNAELTLGDEITAGKDLLRAKNNAVATIADGLVLHAERLHSTFPLAPDGYLYVLEHDVRMLGSMDFEGAIAKFLVEVVTPRERQIIRLMLLGNSMEEIGNFLGVSRGTVKNHRQRLYEKLGINFERQLFAMFLQFLAQENQTRG